MGKSQTFFEFPDFFEDFFFCLLQSYEYKDLFQTNISTRVTTRNNNNNNSFNFIVLIIPNNISLDLIACKKLTMIPLVQCSASAFCSGGCGFDSHLRAFNILSLSIAISSRKSQGKNLEKEIGNLEIQVGILQVHK